MNFDDLSPSQREQLARAAFATVSGSDLEGVDLSRLAFEVELPEDQLGEIDPAQLNDATWQDMGDESWQEDVPAQPEAEGPTSDWTEAKQATDEAADDANPAVERARRGTKPDGMPPLWPLHALPRRQRAAVLRKFQEVPAALERAKKLGEELRERDDLSDQQKVMRLVTIETELYAELEEFLISVASQRGAMEEWVRSADNEALLDGFHWWAETMRPGEAQGSRAS